MIWILKWTASSEFGTYRICEQRRFRRACASAQSRQNLRYSLIQALSQEEPSDRKPDPWPLWMAGHAQLKFVMTECSKTQIRLAGPKYWTVESFSANIPWNNMLKVLLYLVQTVVACILSESQKKHGTGKGACIFHIWDKSAKKFIQVVRCIKVAQIFHLSNAADLCSSQT